MFNTEKNSDDTWLGDEAIPSAFGPSTGVLPHLGNAGDRVAVRGVGLDALRDAAKKYADRGWLHMGSPQVRAQRCPDTGKEIEHWAQWMVKAKPETWARMKWEADRLLALDLLDEDFDGD